MKTITKNELTKALKGKKLARLYCKGYIPEAVEERLQKVDDKYIKEMEKIYRLSKVRTNDIIITNTITKNDTICDLRNVTITEIEFRNVKGYTIEFLNKETKEPYANVMYVPF